MASSPQDQSNDQSGSEEDERPLDPIYQTSKIFLPRNEEPQASPYPLDEDTNPGGVSEEITEEHEIQPGGELENLGAATARFEVAELDQPPKRSQLDEQKPDSPVDMAATRRYAPEPDPNSGPLPYEVEAEAAPDPYSMRPDLPEHSTQSLVALEEQMKAPRPLWIWIAGGGAIGLILGIAFNLLMHRS